MKIKIRSKIILRIKQGKVPEAIMPSILSTTQIIMILPKIENGGHNEPLPFQINTVHKFQQLLLLKDLWFGWSAVCHLSDDLTEPLAAAGL